MPCLFISNLVMAIGSLVNSFFIRSSLIPTLNLWKFVLFCMPFSYGWVSIDSPLNGASWFISVYFLCHCIYFGILKTKSKYETAYLPLCVAMIFLGWSLYEMNLNIPFLYRQTSRGYICFFVGVLLNNLVKQKFNKKLLSVFGLLAIGSMTALELNVQGAIGNVKYSACFIIFPLLIFLVTSLEFLQKVLSLRLFLYLGERSMSIYLIHYPVLRIIRLINFGILENPADPSSIVTFGVILAVLMIVSISEFEVLEKRIFPKYIPKLIALIKQET